MTRRGGSLPNCLIFNSEIKKYMFLRINGQKPNLPEGWEFYESSVIDLERRAFSQIVSITDAEDLLPEEIIQLRV